MPHIVDSDVTSMCFDVFKERTRKYCYLNSFGLQLSSKNAPHSQLLLSKLKSGHTLPELKSVDFENKFKMGQEEGTSGWLIFGSIVTVCVSGVVIAAMVTSTPLLVAGAVGITGVSATVVVGAQKK